MPAGYSYANIHNNGGDPDPPAGRMESDIEATVHQIIMADHGPGISINRGSNNPGLIRGLSPSNATHLEKATRHTGGANYAFFDGHVAWYAPERVACSPGECWWGVQDEH